MRSATTIQLLGSFELSVDGQPVHVPLQAQRLLALLAIGDSADERHRLAERLWPFTRHDRAHANLRTAVWRIRRAAPDALVVRSQTVGLDRRIDVDYREVLDTGRTEAMPPRQRLRRLRADLLPGWDEDWLMIERERTRQARMRGLEQLSSELLNEGRTGEAMDAAYASIEIEPLRESAHLALIEVHVSDGNLAEAAHHVERVRSMLRDELDIDPSQRFCRRIAELGVS